jgi:NNP family nitrate/nitrite transporter-like MFS transporter
MDAADLRTVHQDRALWLSTIAFTICFAVWTIFSIIGIRIKEDLGLSETEFGLLVGTPILTGSLVRVVLGVWTARYGGRLVYVLTMLAAALATFLLAYAETYLEILVAALGVGIAGGSFAVGVTYVSRVFPPEKQGTALGIFGAGNVGAALTKFLAPFVLLALGWQAVAQIWAGALVLIAAIFWLCTDDDPVTSAGDADGERRKSFLAEFAPLRNLQVWRFALYYFFVFGAFVALALWLPRYVVGAYGSDIATAGMVAAAYTIPASIFRAYGGVLSDQVGARTVMYWTLSVSAAATLILSFSQIGLPAFVVAVLVLGFFMSLGKAAVFKHVATYYPDNVGAVGGLVGMIGGLGGFVLPIAFGALYDATGLWPSCFALLFLIASISLVWMHLAVRRMERRAGSATPASVEAYDMAAQ